MSLECPHFRLIGLRRKGQGINHFSWANTLSINIYCGMSCCMYAAVISVMISENFQKSKFLDLWMDCVQRTQLKVEKISISIGNQAHPTSIQVAFYVSFMTL